MNLNFQLIEFLRSCLVSLILTPFARTKWLTQIFVDCNRLNSLNEVLNEPLKEYSNKRCKDKTRTKLTETSLMTPTSIHTTKTKHQNKV